MNPSNQQQELREAIGRIVYRVHTDGRLQGKVAQDAVKWKSEVMDPIDEIEKLVHSHMQAGFDYAIEPNGRVATDDLPDPYNISPEIQRRVKERQQANATKYLKGEL